MGCVVSQSPDVTSISARTVNLVIGCLAISLPMLLFFVGLTIPQPIENTYCGVNHKIYADSISHYYCWSDVTRNIFVGVLTGVALLFLAYRGWAKVSMRVDRVIALACSVLALCVANFPAEGSSWVSWVHGLSAGLLFSILSYIAACRFSENSEDEDERENHHWKAVRNGLFRIFSIVMLFGIVFIVFNFVLIKIFNLSPVTSRFVFWGELITLVAFGFAWLTKSRFIFGYKKYKYHFLFLGADKNPRQLYLIVAKLGGECRLCKIPAWLAKRVKEKHVD